MPRSPDALLRLKYDDFRLSSVIRHQNAASAASARRKWSARLAVWAAALMLAACQAETAPAPKAERPVQVQRVAFETGAIAREFVGVVHARYETDLGFRVAGKIVARVVNVGDRVRAGDVIARLDSCDLQLQVESAEAELAAATSSLAQAASDLQRYTTLKSKGYASVAEFDRKQAANDEAEGRLARARRSLDLARNQLAYAELKSDADGVITATLAEPGQVVAIGQAVARLAHKGEKEALVALPETFLDEAQQAKATVRLWSGGERSFTARLRELAPQADPATRTFAARFTILDADDTVAFGMTATVKLERERGMPVARLPLAAVLNRGTGPTVYVVDDSGALVLRPVTVAAFTGDAALITGGVNNGDRIVTLGVQTLEAGLRVRTIEASQ
ncbi:MAG: efflux RND transporter periplasmic adaptor subunit [Rhizobiales bacterium]|nr:efflux RND transporter periplasmic adaptor subunit [Hyphomicrobiales bacterium]